MARLSTNNIPAAASDPTAINLNRMLVRLQQTLITPDAETESRLHASPFEREKVGTNLDYSRTLLLRLEQDAQSIKVQSRKQETQADLIRKREQIQRLAERLQELNDVGDFQSERENDDTSEGEDLLGEDTPSEDTSSHVSQIDPTSTTPSPIESSYHSTLPETIAPPALQQPPLSLPKTQEPYSGLRERNKALEKDKAELLNTHPAISSKSTRTDTGMSTATSEALLSHNRLEQENLTSSLAQMATALKQSANSFSQSLDEEKNILDSAVKGLDKNELGLEAAQRKMGTLRTLSEGKGWWGRMMLYAWIFGLMVIAILVVFVMPKLRF